MRADLLERGRQLLLADAANPHGVKFNLGTWAEPDRSDKDRITDPTIVKHTGVFASGRPNLDWAQGAEVPVSCGTQACAMGLFAISRAFEDEGLGYNINLSGNLYPVYNEEYGFDAAARLFDIDVRDAAYLFDPDCYADLPTGEDGERLVAARIEAFINGDIDERHHPAHVYGDDDDDDDDE